MSGPSSRRDANASPDTAFTATHWSVILAAAQTSAPGAGEALEKLCRTYWPSVYAYIRRQGSNAEVARDLTQEFFAQFLARKHVKLADPGRGRFRSFLITSLKNFLVSQWRRGQTEKRGGGQWLLSLDDQRNAETRFMAEPADPAMTPDRVFEKRWALTLLDQVLFRLRAELTASSRQEHFDALRVFVWGNPGTVSQGEVAARLGMNVNTFGVWVHRLRHRFGELVRAEIAQTVASPAEIDDELRHLMDVVGS